MSEQEGNAPITNPQLIKEFSINSPKVVSRLIHTVFEEENALYIFPNLVGNYFMSEIIEIEVEGEEQYIWVTCPSEAEFRKNINSNQVYAVVSFADGVKIQFTGVKMELLPHGKVQALRLPMPARLVRLQRRNHARLLVDKELEDVLHIPEDVIQNYELIDISLGGCGMQVSGQPKDYQVGLIIRNATLHLNDGLKPIQVALIVRNIFVDTDGTGFTCLGCAMEMLNKSDETRFQKFILYNEQRQRKARRGSF